MPISTRHDGEQLLTALRMREAGLSASAIGKRLGMTPTRVRVCTNRVLDADLAESGEPEDVVLAGYGWDRSTSRKRRVARC